MEHAARGLAWAQAIEQSAIAQAVRESLWFYPFANTTHVLAMAMLVGAIVVFDLRVLGVLGAGRAADAARMALPVARLGFVLAVPSGVAMFIAEATAYLANPVFLIKLGAIAAEYGVTGIPQTVIIGKDGKVQVVHVGFSPNLQKQLTSELESLLAGKDLAAEELAKHEKKDEEKAEPKADDAS